MAVQNTIELRTERLVLRRPQLADAERLALVANDRRIARNMTGSFPNPYDEDDARAFLSRSTTDFAITTRDAVGTLSPGLVGMTGHVSGGGEDADVFTFGYWLTPEAWGRGLATEAAGAAVDHLLATESVRRIEARVYAWNPASARVLEKLGFKPEGRTRSSIRRFGEVTDELIFGLLPGDR